MPEVARVVFLALRSRYDSRAWRRGPHPRGVGSALSRESRQHALLIVRQDETLVLCSHHDPKRVIRVAECDPSQRVKTNDQLSNSLTCDPELFGNHAAGHRSIQQIEQTLTARSRLLCSSRSIWPGLKAAGRAARCRPPCPGPKAFLTAIAIAQRQKARCFELRAALALAKLYQSTGRPAEAHAVLALALEGFAPTDEMPEIAEAQALLVAIEADAHVRRE
jgi:hypothetical protein